MSESGFGAGTPGQITGYGKSFNPTGHPWEGLKDPETGELIKFNEYFSREDAFTLPLAKAPLTQELKKEDPVKFEKPGLGLTGEKAETVARLLAESVVPSRPDKNNPPSVPYGHIAVWDQDVQVWRMDKKPIPVSPDTTTGSCTA